MTNLPFVSVSNLTKKYSNSFDNALTNINLNIYKGEVIGLLGPNGAGKTTLISLICGLMKESSGQIHFEDILLSNNIKQNIGLVPQDIALYGTLTVRENLSFFGAMYGIYGKELKKKIDYWIDKLHLSACADKQIDLLSGGMKRRTNLISSILHEPKLLILDEPTVGVDVQSRATIIQCLKELNKDGMTIIYTSHLLDEAEELCTKIAIIKEGLLISYGTIEDLKARFSNLNTLEEIFLDLTNKTLPV